MTEDRSLIILSNVLGEVFDKCFAGGDYSADPDDFIPWLHTEIGMTDEEIEVMKEKGLWITKR